MSSHTRVLTDTNSPNGRALICTNSKLLRRFIRAPQGETKNTSLLIFVRNTSYGFFNFNMTRIDRSVVLIGQFQNFTLKQLLFLLCFSCFNSALHPVYYDAKFTATLGRFFFY